MSLLAFANGNEAAAVRAAFLSNALLAAGPSVMSTINGAGLVRHEPQNKDVRPCVFVDQNRLGLNFDAGIVPIDALMELPVMKPLIAIMDPLPDWFYEALAWVFPAAVPQDRPGQAILQQDIGVLGFPVTWSNGEGFLTAGHVAAPGRGVVSLFPMNTPFAQVEFSLDPNGSGVAPEVDVAVLRTLTPLQRQARSLFNPVSATADVTDTVDILNGAPHQDWIRAYSTAYYCQTQRLTGTFAETYLTASGTTQAGDSGSAVVVNNHPLGTVVAGSAGYTTLIQKFDYQIAKTGLTNLRIA